MYLKINALFCKLFSLSISTNYEKNKLAAASIDFEGLTVNVSLRDKSGNPLEIGKSKEIFNEHFPILFVQNKLLEVFAEEIFSQQKVWDSVQLKDVKDCNTLERELKAKPHRPYCSEVINRLLNSFDISSLCPDKHATEAKTCMGKLEEMVKDKWDDFNKNRTKTSF